MKIKIDKPSCPFCRTDPIHIDIDLSQSELDYLYVTNKNAYLKLFDYILSQLPEA